MGASSWTYFVPYRPEIDRALQDLRAEVFRRGEYFAVHRDRRPATVEQLMESNGEDGTHSILDIFAVSERPGLSVAAPLSRQELVDLFGTDRPTRTLVEGNRTALDTVRVARGRWAGTYIVLYDGDVPSEILFFGLSGD